MAERTASGGQSKSRSVLGDLTNRIGKRGVSGREKIGVKCFDYNDENTAKRICVSPRPCSEINSLKGNVISGLSKVPNQNRDPNLSCFRSSIDVNGERDGGLNVGNSKLKNMDNVVSQSVDKLDIVECSNDDPNLADKEGEKALNLIANEADAHRQIELDSSKNVVDLTITSGGEFEKGNPEMHNKENDPISVNSEAEDELGDSFSAETSKTVSETRNGGKNFDGGEVNTSRGGIHGDINSNHNDLDDHNADNFILSQSGSVDFTILPQSQESRVFGTDKSTKRKEDDCDHMTMRNNSIGACSCSFCTNAAYIWLDLHHKDIKARMSALKKSQKDASILAEKSWRNKETEKHQHGPESSSKVSKMESHLMNQWRSLFKYMSNIWEEEGNQLEANQLQLNNLKEKCRAELELINAKQSGER